MGTRAGQTARQPGGQPRRAAEGQAVPADGTALTQALLSAARSLVDGMQERLAAGGFADVRPAHGFTFVRLAPDGATVGEVAEHLGVSKQAASQLVDDLVEKGYVLRHPHPTDARARLVLLTDRGWACTRASEDAAADVAREWATVLGERRLAALSDDLSRVAPPGRLRPAW